MLISINSLDKALEIATKNKKNALIKEIKQ